MATATGEDPEIPILEGLLEDYRRQYDIGEGILDRSKVEHLYKMDDEFTAYDVAPPLEGYVGWDQYKVGWYKVLEKYSEIHFRFRETPRIFRQGDVAWMSVSADWFGTSRGGDDFAKQFRLTLIWVRGEDGRWRITHEHGSSPRSYALAGGEIV
ncbi:YybH family protein [Flavisphingomonas formosensis]|uniref:YybH family protein n=1 Tax=Flavisphingomonas formosensis TaxID=861534 RepID=UPI0012F8AA8B|nr:nuclear transport factor 2 family protein [Sphingomonas formosensis]